MNILSIDLTVTPGTLSLLASAKMQTAFLHDQRSQGTEIIPTIQALLIQADRKIRDLTEIWVVLGPGSFTGIRVAVATTLGLAAPHGIPVCGITAFSVMACKATREGASFPFCTAQRSHQGDYFCQYWRHHGDHDTPYQGLLPADVPVYLRTDTTASSQELAVTSLDVLLVRDVLYAENHQLSELKPFYIRAPDVTRSSTV
ncbi:MAG: tRNA (adenosine(37)-N6)-threonylcarbamoyltransferase complex dimerization subunit type 1 TsaB [Alphaproteobacteria bacterium]|nr:MAG: tRNA (adenosine(37)-N6)-threonylcarbamoyltransferase complex dimerization subunit type 1 TsaB [Alphaproteobacteria bacterium]